MCLGRLPDLKLGLDITTNDPSRLAQYLYKTGYCGETRRSVVSLILGSLGLSNAAPRSCMTTDKGKGERKKDKTEVPAGWDSEAGKYDYLILDSRVG